MEIEQRFTHVRYEDKGKIVEYPVTRYTESTHEDFNNHKCYDCLIKFKIRLHGVGEKPVYHSCTVLLCVDPYGNPTLSIRQAETPEKSLWSSSKDAYGYWENSLLLVPIMEYDHVGLKKHQTVVEHRKVLDLTHAEPLQEWEDYDIGLQKISSQQ